MTLSITTPYIEWHYAESQYAQCHYLFIVMLNVTLLNVTMLSDIMLNVVAPKMQTILSFLQLRTLTYHLILVKIFQKCSNLFFDVCQRFLAALLPCPHLSHIGQAG